MKSLTAVLYARVLESEVRRSAKGRDYLSIKAEPLEEKAAAKIGAIWVTSFHKSHMAAGLKPGIQIRVEGPLDVRRYEADGEKRIALWLTAEGLTFAVDASPSPLAGAQAAGEKVAAQEESGTTLYSMLNATRTGLPPQENLIGSAITASPSDFEPKNKTKRSAAELAALSCPAEMGTGKRHERPFNDDLPF